jgi:hypothetical protein
MPSNDLRKLIGDSILYLIFICIAAGVVVGITGVGLAVLFWRLTHG